MPKSIREKRKKDQVLKIAQWMRIHRSDIFSVFTISRNLHLLSYLNILAPWPKSLQTVKRRQKQIDGAHEHEMCLQTNTARHE